MEPFPTLSQLNLYQSYLKSYESFRIVHGILKQPSTRSDSVQLHLNSLSRILPFSTAFTDMTGKQNESTRRIVLCACDRKLDFSDAIFSATIPFRLVEARLTGLKFIKWHERIGQTDRIMLQRLSR